METREYRIIDKSKWGLGPWDSEPDKKQWTDEETGYPCLIHRNAFGALCGYVGVSEGHPLFQKEYLDVDADIDVHGGLSYSDFCQRPKVDGRGICHIPDPGESDRVWWFGFDCSHFMDLVPMYRSLGGVYRDADYVAYEVKRLARQLRDLEQS